MVELPTTEHPSCHVFECWKHLIAMQAFQKRALILAKSYAWF